MIPCIEPSVKLIFANSIIQDVRDEKVVTVNVFGFSKNKLSKLQLLRLISLWEAIPFEGWHKENEQ